MSIRIGHGGDRISMTLRRAALASRTLAWIAGALVLGVPAGSRAAEPRTAEPRTVGSLPGLEIPSLRSETVSRAEAGEVYLRRAITHLGQGDVVSAAADLERCGFAGADGQSEELDRAAFLLAEIYLQLGDFDRFADLAAQVARWGRDSGYTRWIADQALTLAPRGASAVPAGPARPESHLAAVAASLLLEAGDPVAAQRWIEQSHLREHPLGLYLSGIAAAASGESSERWLERLARVSPSTPFEADLVGAAVVQMGRDLQLVPPTSRYAPRALHLRAVQAMERGDRTTARTLAEQLRLEYPDYRDLREAELLLGAAELDDRDWDAAHERFLRMEGAHQRAVDELARLESPAGLDSLWAAWRRGAPDSDFLLLDLSALQTEASRLVEASLDLRKRPEFPGGGAEPVEGSIGARTFAAQPYSPPLSRWVPPPPVTKLRAVGALETEASSTYSDLERVQWQIEQARLELDRRRAYLEGGLSETRAEIEILEGLVRQLEALAASIDDVLNEVDRVTEAYLAHVLARAQRILEQTAEHQTWIASMEHFYVYPGPASAIPDAIPENVPLPDSLLVGDRAFAGTLGGRADYLHRTLPDRVRRSRDEIWKPGLGAKTAELLAEARRLLENARNLETLLVAGIDRLETDNSLAALHDRARSLRTSADSLAGAAMDLRRATTREALAEVQEAWRRHEEAVRYGAATAAYELGMPHDSTGLVSEVPPHLIEAYRSEARGRFEAFLADYPESFTRAEVRFRLADVYLVDSKERFSREMADFLERQQRGAGFGALPVMEYDAALQTYLSILETDPGYPHRDAVLYHVGVIMADLGDDRAMGYLEELIAEHPHSAFQQEAYLRMGDYQFDTRDFDRCVAFYEEAARGSDRSLTAIALYKTGWARFNRDQFEEAADAFRRVLDVYELGAVDVETDLQGEAEDYLVHCLARAGGGPMAAAYFDRIGNRPYETRILLGLSQLLHRYSLFAEAVEADRLWLDRYPEDPAALGTAQRLIGGLETWNKPDQANQVRLQLAQQFRRGGTWKAANDSLAAEADAFAHGAIRHVALFHHHEARKESAEADGHWSRALQLYGELIAGWPDGAETPKFRFYSGEAAARLNNHELAFEHFTAAALADTGSFVPDAAWLRVAVVDGWYEASRPTAGTAVSAEAGATSRPGAGDPQRARMFMTVSDEYRADYPEDPRNADLLWRGGQLALMHEWPATAAERFGLFIDTHPGDERAPMAGALRGDALHREEKYGEAGKAYEVALNLARGAGDDTLATRVAAAIPASFYREAEVVADAAAQPSEHTRAAALFETVSVRYPRFEFADLAMYRAGLAYLKGDEPSRGVGAFEAVLWEYPESEYVRDCHLQIATTHERTGQPLLAAQAYERYADRYPEEGEAADALLRSSELLEEGGDAAGAEATRLRYIDRYPDDVETAMNVLHGLARRDLDQVSAGRPISAVAPEAGAAGGSASTGVTTPSHLARYLGLAGAHPELSDPEILARVDFLRGEEARTGFDRVYLRQPLEASIGQKNAALQTLVAHYQACSERAILPWSRAAAYRIGDALVAFGDGLLESERPRNLNGDDLAAYDEVLEEQAWGFFDKGEEIWAEVLRQAAREDVAEDAGGWVTRTREGLWPRVSQRFVHYAAADYPVITPRKPPVSPARTVPSSGAVTAPAPGTTAPAADAPVTDAPATDAPVTDPTPESTPDELPAEKPAWRQR